MTDTTHTTPAHPAEPRICSGEEWDATWTRLYRHREAARNIIRDPRYTGAGKVNGARYEATEAARAGFVVLARRQAKMMGELYAEVA